MCDLSQGRKEPCKNSIGGIKAIYLMPFVKYGLYEIDVINGSELISFPSTTVYKYELRADGNDFNQSITIDDNGESWTQSVNGILKQIDTLTTNELFKVARKELRVIVEAYTSKFYLLGLQNGVNIDFTTSTGGSKSDFNGYNITIEGTEKYAAPEFDNLNAVGFTVAEDVETNHILLQSSDKFLLQNNNNLTLQNG